MSFAPCRENVEVGKMPSFLGICLGAVTVTTSERNGNEGPRFSRVPHEGRVAEVLAHLLHDRTDVRVCLTGRRFRRGVDLPSIAEVEAVELAYRHLGDRHLDADSILSAGGEAFLLYSLDPKGRVRSVISGNRCAAGTGDFFRQQVARMGLSVEEAVALASASEPHEVASRCSVFCKSDCTHALNKGLGKGAVAAGLCRMMAGRMLALIQKAGVRRPLVVGGVALNTAVMEAVRQDCPGVSVTAEGPCFEAFGAMLWINDKSPCVKTGFAIQRPRKSIASPLPALAGSQGSVTFHTSVRGELESGVYVLGLDVGSTTTKAVLVRADTRQIAADTYLRTEGDPVQASRACYRAICDQMPAGLDARIVGLGVTGSGRRIAALHAQTRSVVNEITAHAAAAVRFAPDVDTIFEIGGQDAKYTHLVNGAAVDYAMNEACSAGTGSFLEESCFETLGIPVEAIGDIALRAPAPSDFSDQCAAFISSDIKGALHEGVDVPDVVAGLVYAVCRNFLTRVKGNRPVGKRLLMQGGVCYNRAVPHAMAKLCGQHVCVPPDPGLMGAYGAALVTWDALEAGDLTEGSFDLGALVARRIEPLKPFTCRGDGRGCDGRCSIRRYSVEGKIYLFGGVCDRYCTSAPAEGKRRDIVDLVRRRNEIIAHPSDSGAGSGHRPAVGIPFSLLTRTYYPLYERFFLELGFSVHRSEDPDPGGMSAAGSEFCLPVLHAHGHMANLLHKELDRIFVPYVLRLPPNRGALRSCSCPFVQAEPDILKAAFAESLTPLLVTEVLNFDRPKELAAAFVRIGAGLGFGALRSRRAFRSAWSNFEAVRGELHRAGREFLDGLAPDGVGIVLLGRPYHAFCPEANMAVQARFAGQGVPVIPHDMLPPERLPEPSSPHMYWGQGQAILQAARYVRGQDNLFGVLITSFGCGPDSFLLQQVRAIMQDKPFLVLEMDAHTADAGIDTRVEAFLDVVRDYRRTQRRLETRTSSSPAAVKVKKGCLRITTSSGEVVEITDPRVRILVPSMSHLASRMAAAAMRYAGLNAAALPPPGRAELELGKRGASCRECLPYLLTAGSLARRLEEGRESGEVTVFFMPGADGPCRFGQYSPAISDLVHRQGYKDVGILTPVLKTGYGGMPDRFARRCLLGTMLADGLADVRASCHVLAADAGQALAILSQVENRVEKAVASEEEERVLEVLESGLRILSGLPRARSGEGVTHVLLTGEIYVRQDGFSRHRLVERLAEEGILVHVSPICEWLRYADHIVQKRLEGQTTLAVRARLALRASVFSRMDKRIRGLFSSSGLYYTPPLDMDFLLERGARLVNPRLTGEAILTVASAMTEIGDEAHGVVSVAPFGCMPGRIASAILSQRLEADKASFSRHRKSFWAREGSRFSLPFLHLETDGSDLSPTEEARLEGFILSANRLRQELAADGRISQAR